MNKFLGLLIILPTYSFSLNNKDNIIIAVCISRRQGIAPTQKCTHTELHTQRIAPFKKCIKFFFMHKTEESGCNSVLV